MILSRELQREGIGLAKARGQKLAAPAKLTTVVFIAIIFVIH
jgi:hypothetical protein